MKSVKRLGWPLWFLEVIDMGEEKVDYALKFFPTLVELGKALELFANPASDFKKAVSEEACKALAEIVEDPEALAYAKDRIKSNTPQSQLNTPQSQPNGYGLRRSKRLLEKSIDKAKQENAITKQARNSKR